jgi:hypothetical protein
VDPDDTLSSEIDAEATAAIDCIVHLYSGLTERERAAVVLSLRNYLAETAHLVGEAAFLANGTTALEARLTPADMRETARSFSTVRSFTPNRVYFLTDSTPFYPVNPNCTVVAPTCSVAVAVFDGGINANSRAFSGVIQAVLPSLPSGAVAPLGEHGSFVASRVIYGDDIEQQQQSGVLEPKCPLVDVPIFGKDATGRAVPVTEPQLAVAIERAISALPNNARVLNLSLGTDSPILDASYSLVAQVLDEQARKRDLIPVVTAGNIRDPRRIATYPREVDQPHWRIDPPAESLLSVTVGSIARYVDAGALSRVGELSPFSRRGPGADGGVKPELVAHGGNCLANGQATSRVATQGIHPTGSQVAWDIGTSFAAPLVASAAAEICHHYVNPPANLVKALLFHFAERALSPATSLDECFLTGFGEPRVAAALAAAAHNAAFLFTGSVRTGCYQYLPFYVPAAFATDARARLRVRATLVFDPPVNPNNQAEYSQARMAVALRKAVELGFRDVSVAAAMFAGTPWSPVLHFDQRFARGFASGIWELRTRLWTRELPDEYEQKYAAVIEVIDSSGMVDVWNDVTREHPFGVVERSGERTA